MGDASLYPRYAIEERQVIPQPSFVQPRVVTVGARNVYATEPVKED